MTSDNKYGEVKIDGKEIHIPNSYHYTQLYVVKYWDNFKVVSPQGETLSEGPRPYMNRSREIPWQSILKNWIRKPRSITYSRYYTYLPGRIAHYLNNESMKIRKERVDWLQSLIIKYNMQEIDERFFELLPTDDNDYEQESLQDSIVHPYDVNWSIYDSLQPLNHSLKGEEV